MDKILIVYYSRTGNTRKVAEALQAQLGADIEEIKSLKSYAGPIGWILAGKEGSQKVHGKIKPAVKNPADYDLIILGTPVWAWDMSSPMRAYIIMNKDKFKKVAAFCTMGGTEGQTLAEMERICGMPLVAKLALIDKDILADKIDLKNFLKEITKK